MWGVLCKLGWKHVFLLVGWLLLVYWLAIAFCSFVVIGSLYGLLFRGGGQASFDELWAGGLCLVVLISGRYLVHYPDPGRKIQSVRH